MRNRTSCGLFILANVLFGQLAYASQVSTGPDGINSSGLGLTGNGVGIGQVELSRPGDPKDNSQAGPPYPDFDTVTARLNDAIDPERVFYTTVNSSTGVASYTATPNAAGETGSGHATQVAGVLISTNTTVVMGDTRVGVATQADLFASGFGAGVSQDPQDIASVAAQYVATRNGGNISAINISFGFDLSGGDLADGTSTFSSFVDWSSKVHDVLYVAAGPYTSPSPGTANIRLPADNFNGITVAFSKKDTNGKYRIVDDRNIFVPNPWSPLTERTFTDLLAPGDNIFVATQGNASAFNFGTSIAVPHVTGGVALLQEYANTQIGNGIPGWTSLARRHEVMKAVLMNSADKIAGRLGSTRTVLKKNGDNWDDTDASFNDFLPLDEEMGAGHLNVSRAVTQYASGAQGPNGVPVPLIGWDYDSTGFDGDINKYVLNQELAQGSYISITLAWDREVTFSVDNGVAGVFDSGDEFNGYSEVDADDVINDLTLYLMEKGAGPFDDPIWSSAQDYMPLEHLFVPIFEQGEYEIWVEQLDDELGGGQDYAIAWWAEGVGPLLSGDFDDDSDVDGADFLTWQRDTTVGNLADWQNGYGNTGTLAATNITPEPSTWMLFFVGLLTVSNRRARG